MDDAALVRQVLAGDNEAYAVLVDRWAGRVLALCQARMGRTDLAEELAQETFVRGLEVLPSLSDPARFGPWLASIAANVCRDWHKSRQNGQTPFSALARPPAEASAAPGPADLAEHADDLDRLRHCLAELPEEYRVVLMLFYFEKTRYRDIAQVLDVSAATVNARLTRARALLRARLAEESAKPAPTTSGVQPT